MPNKETYLTSYGEFDIYGKGSRYVIRDYTGKKIKTFSSKTQCYYYIDCLYEEDPYHI